MVSLTVHSAKGPEPETFNRGVIILGNVAAASRTFGMTHSISGLSDAQASLISVIIPNLDGFHFLEPCLNSLFAQGMSPEQLDVLVIDNGSQDGSAEQVRQRFPAVRVFANDANVGFTRAVNQGIDAARGGWILLLNNDTVLEPGSLKALVQYMQSADQDVAGMQPLLLWAGDPNVIDSAGIRLGKHFTARDHLHGRPVSDAPTVVTEMWGICFACALIRRGTFEHTGGLDPDFFAEWDDVDFACRARRSGYRFMLVPEARVLHHRSPTQTQLPKARLVRYRRNRLLTILKSLPLGMVWQQWFYRAQKDLFSLPHHVGHRQLSAVLRSWREAIGLVSTMRQRRRELFTRASVISDSSYRALVKRFTMDE